MMTIREYKRAESLEEAWQLNQKKPNRILGGLIWLKMETIHVGTAIDLSGLGLDTIEETEDSFSIGAMAPGPFAVNIATYVGAEVGGIFGSFCATLGVILPSFIIILIVAKCFMQFQKSIVIKGCMSGLKPAVVGLIGSAVISMSSTVFIPDGFNTTVFTDISFYTTLIIFLISVVLAFKKLNPILIICLSAILGIVCGYI